ncbi:MAG: histidinol-phosphate transaminase [Chloroflexi bacterium]|nr:histidinol-phosphate transaminase [Chloroflexota bacterium]
MYVQPRADLQNVVPCYHGSLSHQEREALALDGDVRSNSIVDFSVNTNPLGPSPLVKSIPAEVDVHRYPDTEAILLRQALGERLGVGIDNIVVGNGSVELIWHICLAYLSHEDRALVLGPTFGEYEAASRIMGAEVVEYRSSESDGFKPQLENVLRAIDERQPKLVFVCNPNNPTGYYFGREETLRLIAGAERSLVVVDEAYAGFADGRWPSEDLIRQPNVVLLRSMTKDYALAGLRIGYALADAAVVDVIEKVRPPWSTNALAQRAGIVSLQDEEHLARSRVEVGRAKEYLASALADLGLRPLPSRANFFLLKIGDGTAFRSKLLRKGFCVRDCGSFGLPDYVRIGVRTEAECRQLVAAIAEVL